MTDMSAQEFAKALATVLTTQDPLSPGQQQAALQYRLIRNGLGNYGGHGDAGGDLALIRMTQTLLPDRVRLTLQDALPRAASQLALYAGIRPQLIETVWITGRRTGSYWVCQNTLDVQPIVRVEVLDQAGAPIAAGVPTEVAIAQIRMTQTIRNSNVSILTFEDALPDQASQLVLHIRTPKQEEIVEMLKQINPKDRSYELSDETDDVELIVRVDVLDREGAPIATGVPDVDVRRVPRQRAARS
jgi:hypothetical protein